MTPQRAQEIVSAINARAWMTMEIVDEAGSLAGVTLAEMLEAKQIVQSGNAADREAPRAPGETYAINVVPDDRLIAAVYVHEHYPPDRSPILCLPYRGLEGNRKVLAVLAVDAELLIAEDDE